MDQNKASFTSMVLERLAGLGNKGQYTISYNQLKNIPVPVTYLTATSRGYLKGE
jgi:hypothetical protein